MSEIIGRRIKPGENTTLVKLSMVDQIKILFSRFSNNDAAELNANEKLSIESLKKKASLQRLFETAISRMKEDNKSSVTLSVSSKYLPYIDQVIDTTTGLGRYYEFNIVSKDLPLNVEYKFIVTIKKRRTEKL